jgi:predicted regulator of amino acid metabolism with ACT domain
MENKVDNLLDIYVSDNKIIYLENVIYHILNKYQIELLQICGYSMDTGGITLTCDKIIPLNIIAKIINYLGRNYLASN